MTTEEGFEVRLVAAEPLVTAPVAMIFDARNRIWVAEMNGYMPDTLGTGEEVPNGKIVILEDRDGDGKMDKRTVFLDSLVLPRAICLIGNGILVAEPPGLWFYEIDGDRPGKRVLVDPEYAVGGNVEHQPNGLYRALDNWIYNAKSSKRYRRYGGKWVIEKTHARGQWGISQDNYGRLYTNHNSQNLIGDYFLPGFGAANPNLKSVAGFNVNVVKDTRVYPAHPTPGVNRGYMDGILDAEKRLVNFTAACGPLVYRGALFGNDYGFNAFVAEPSANLIKRNVLTDQGYVVSGRPAYPGREFLVSTDERFRPVSLYDAPDGALYVVDMYRGIIQHKTYLTPYLKGEIGLRRLTSPLSCGRIYKIVPQGAVLREKPLPEQPGDLVVSLGAPNGWIRDYAQRTIIDRQLLHTEPALRAILKESKDELKRIHAFWTLEGLGLLRSDDVTAALRDPKWTMRMQAFAAVRSVISRENHKDFLAAFGRMISGEDTLSFPYIAFQGEILSRFDQAGATALLLKLAGRSPGNRYVADAIVSSLHDREIGFGKELSGIVADTSRAIYRQLGLAAKNAENARSGRNPAQLAAMYPKGASLFGTICQTCHGADGNGVPSLAPPLNKSEWVTGHKDKLISIVLFGLSGPVEVNRHVYKAPEINGDMPGIGYDETFSNADVAQLLSYIRKLWQNNAGPVSGEEVEQVRKRFARRERPFTVEELDRL